jgi:hypothetical protein
MCCEVSALNPRESDRNATAELPVVGVDLAKSVFQLAADRPLPTDASSRRAAMTAAGIESVLPNGCGQTT